MDTENLESSVWRQKFKKVQKQKSITKEFIKDFYRNFTQRHNKTTALIKRLKKVYIVYGVYVFARQMTKKCLNYQRNKFLKHKLYRNF